MIKNCGIIQEVKLTSYAPNGFEYYINDENALSQLLHFFRDHRMTNTPSSYDLHLHTEFSPDSSTPLEAYARCANQLAIHIGFLDHFELAFLDRIDYLNPNRFPRLLEEYDRVHSQYPYTSLGLEVDYYTDLAPQLAEFCDDYKKDFDYFIGVVHTIDRLALTIVEEMEELVKTIGLREILERYFDEVESAIRSQLFSGIAHIDGVMRFLPLFPGSPEVNSLWKQRTKELGLLCQEQGVLIEVNLRGLNHPWGRMHPDPQIIDELILSGAKFFVGSDSHSLKDFENTAPQLCQLNAYLAEKQALRLPESIQSSILQSEK
ncbi:MAG: histidinol-phosphatase HisJ family protein [Candidatus Hermodarchaeota archaeon]|nr:histidinol-phosphatase HisJ family protein [Candidatus Hermodarchaeota archaeon]